MINNNHRNISRFPGPVPEEVAGGGNRLISEAPIYERAEVLALAEEEDVNLWSNGARRDAAKWSLDIGDLSSLIAAAVQGGRFVRAEWCQQRPNGPWAACEAWTVTRSEWMDNAGKWMEISYYFKFAISRTGTILLMASNHPENT